MKKIILSLAMIFAAHFMFAGVMIEQDAMGIGSTQFIRKNVFNELSGDYNHSGFAQLSGLSASALWEFNSRSLDMFHFYTGLSFGFALDGFPLSLVGGLNMYLADLGPIRLELNLKNENGVLAGIKGGYNYYCKNTAMLMVMGKKRRGLYGGIGITDAIEPNLNYFVDYGWDNYIQNYIGLCVLVGIRF